MRKVVKVRAVERQQRMDQTESQSWVNCLSSDVKNGEWQGAAQCSTPDQEMLRL